MNLLHFLKILLCLVVLSASTVSFALSYAPSANSPSVSVQNVAKAIRMTGATLAVSVAVKQLLKGVEFVMDPENNQARSKEKANYCAHGGSPCVYSPEEAVKYAMQSDFAVHWKYPFKGCKLLPNQGNGVIECTFKQDNDTRTVAFFNFGNPPLAVSYEQVAEQIIVNAKNGDKQAIAYLQSVANQNNPKPTTPVKPTQPKPPVTTQPKPSNPPTKPIATPKPSNPPAKPANPPKPVAPTQPIIRKKSQAQCDKEWDKAYEICEDLIKKGINNGITGGYKGTRQCAKGLVSQECGGNKIK